MILTGHIPDSYDERDLRFARSPILVGTAPITADDIDLRQFATPIVEQIANNCVGHATRDAAAMGAAADWRPIKLPSAAFPYTVARLLGRHPGDDIVDGGCSPRLAFKGLARWGLVAEERWPEVPETINTIPPDDCFREGESATISAYYRIADGAGSAAALRAALRRLRFPTFAMPVDEAFAEIGSRVYAAPGGKSFGWHDQVIVGFSKSLDAFLVKGSWGRDRGDGGYFWIAASFVERATIDKWVIEIAPEAVS